MTAKAHFGNPMIEQRNLARGKAVVRQDLGVIRVSGEDRLEWLHSMLTSDFKNLKPGQSREALLLNVQGHVEQVFHAFDDGEATSLIVPLDRVDALLKWLDRMMFRSKVEIADVSGQWAVFGSVAELDDVEASWIDPWPNLVLGGARYSTKVGADWNYREYLVPIEEAEAFASGRKIRVTKVPFSTTAKALINNDSRGFVKIISDPATGEVLGGSIVGRHAAELISVIALAVTANLKVTDIEESLLVHPALAEALADAAE